MDKMKIKNLSATFFFMLCIICSNNVYSSINVASPESTESRMKHIHLTGKLSEKIQKKSVPTVPSIEAYIAENLITINFHIVINNEPFKVTIKDSFENIVFEQTFNVSGPGVIQFTFDTVSDEIYLLEIFSNEGYHYGKF